MRHLFLLLALSILSSTVQAQSWTGVMSSNWNDPNNWIGPAVVPGPGSYVTITSYASFPPQLTSNVNIGGLNLNGVPVDFNGYSMTVNNSIGGYTNFLNTTLNNSNPNSDIVLNINMGSLGYYLSFHGNTINDHITFNVSGNDPFYEGNTTNQYNGNVTYNIAGPLGVYLTNSTSCTYAGNFTYNRTVAGESYVFKNGGSVGGNFSYTNTAGGGNYLGHSSVMTNIAGTVNLDVSYPAQSGFYFRKFKNLTNGGSFSLNGSTGFYLGHDTLKLTSLSVQNYKTGGWAEFVNNRIEGNVLIQDHAGYSAGYSTTIYNNHITGNTTVNLNGSNTLFEANSAGTQNQFDGNTVFNLNSGAEVYISHGAKSTFNGNLTINRNAAGYTRAFYAGCTVNGNFAFNNLSSGASLFGNLAYQSLISGTINVNMNLSPVAGVTMHRVVNQTPGGKINIRNSAGFDLKSDSLLVDSLNIIGYRGSAWSMFYNMNLQGHLTLSDSASYTNGYTTTIRNSTVYGNTLIRSYGQNHFYDADGAGWGNTYNGQTIVQLLGPADFYLSNGDTSTFNGNLTVSRTVPGYNRLFASGGIVNGNFSFSNTSSGANALGEVNHATVVSGTLNLNVNLNPIAGFSLTRFRNQTPGGKIDLRNTIGFDLQHDSLKVDSLKILHYRGNAWATFHHNLLDGVLWLSDSSTYTNAYTTALHNNTINGNTIFHSNSNNHWYESDVAGQANQYNGNLNIVMTSGAEVYFSHQAPFNVTGNLSVTRNSAGYTRLFQTGGTVGGNFSYTKSGSGASDLGTGASQTLINGTLNINATQTMSDQFSIVRLKNNTNGGSVNLQSIRALNIGLDTLLLNSFSVTGYGGAAYAYFYNNHLTGNLTLQDDPSYALGYSTSFYNNVINGNTTVTVNGHNNFLEANNAQPNTFNGNASFNANGPGGLYLCHDAASTFNGNLTINRTAAGHTQAFNGGGLVTGNFSYTKNNQPGYSGFGNPNTKTTISGTFNMQASQTLSDAFDMFWLQNNTNGGNVNISHLRGFNMQKDSFKVGTFSISRFGENMYNYFIQNQIDGNLNLSDTSTYTNGYSSYLENTKVSGNTQITVQGNNNFFDANGPGSGNTFLGDVSYNRLGNGGILVAFGDTNRYARNLNLNSAAGIGMANVYFDGSTAANITQTGAQAVVIGHLMLGKTGGANLSLQDPVTVGNACHFVSGHIVSTAANPLIFPNNIGYSNASNGSHVMGYITKIGDDAFSFPLGDEFGLHPIQMSAPGGTTDTFTAYLQSESATAAGFSLASKDAALLSLNPHFFWGLNRISGSNPVTVGLGWGLHPCLNSSIGNVPGLAVARWNGTQWTNLGNSGTTGNNTAGTVTQSVTSTSFGPFVLASTTSGNPFTANVNVSTTGPAGTVCSGAQVTLTATGGTSYTWMPGNLSGASVQVSPNSTTTYTVTATAASGCTGTATRTVNVGTPPVVTTTTTGTAICTGASTSITAGGASTYSWQPGGLSGATVNVSPAATTTYTVTGTNASGCTATATRLITVGNCAACASNVVISTSPYSILLTESQTYITTSGTVLIDSLSFVKFDAASTSYVMLNPGFKASSGSVFIAQALNGCTAGAPQMPNAGETMRSVAMDEAGAGILLYPNPTTGKITVEHPEGISEFIILDLTGKIVMRHRVDGETRSDIDIGHLQAGVYILHTPGYSNIKIIKNN